MTAPQSRYPWKTFAVLTAAGTLTAPLVLPYFWGLQAIVPHPEKVPALTPVLLVLAVMARSLVFLALFTGLGLLLARRTGLGAPWLEHRLDGAPAPAEPLSSIVRPALFWGVVTSLAAFAVDALFLHVLHVDFPAPEIHARIGVPWWRSGLASFSAPFSEEIFDRLFLLSLVAWVGMKLFRVGVGGRGHTAALWTANVLTALFFGWFHISNEQMFANPVPAIVGLRTVLIVLPVGLAFGWLYMRRGLEAAILSHFFVDVIVHVLRPIVEGVFKRP